MLGPIEKRITDLQLEIESLKEIANNSAANCAMDIYQALCAADKALQEAFLALPVGA
jgi:FtsZ-binding cell division protein ZapB